MHTLRFLLTFALWIVFGLGTAWLWWTIMSASPSPTDWFALLREASIPKRFGAGLGTAWLWWTIMSASPSPTDWFALLREASIPKRFGAGLGTSIWLWLAWGAADSVALHALGLDKLGGD